MYAIKKVGIGGSVDEKTLNEVNVMKMLNDKYIVQFFGAWKKHKYLHIIMVYY